MTKIGGMEETKRKVNEKKHKVNVKKRLQGYKGKGKGKGKTQRK